MHILTHECHPASLLSLTSASQEDASASEWLQHKCKQCAEFSMHKNNTGHTSHQLDLTTYALYISLEVSVLSPTVSVLKKVHNLAVVIHCTLTMIKCQLFASWLLSAL